MSHLLPCRSIPPLPASWAHPTALRSHTPGPASPCRWCTPLHPLSPQHCLTWRDATTPSLRSMAPSLAVCAPWHCLPKCCCSLPELLSYPCCQPPSHTSTCLLGVITPWHNWLHSSIPPHMMLPLFIFYFLSSFFSADIKLSADMTQRARQTNTTWLTMPSAMLGLIVEPTERHGKTHIAFRAPYCYV